MFRRLWNLVIRGIKAVVRMISSIPVVVAVTTVAGPVAGILTTTATLVNGLIQYRAKAGECWALSIQQLSWIIYVGLIGAVLISGSIPIALIFSIGMGGLHWVIDSWTDTQLLKQIQEDLSYKMR